MTQALSEFRSPVGQEALRLRMVAMHGREDALLDSSRFPRLLRQANDAEVADVRKVGDDDYEITAQRTSGLPLSPPATPVEEPSTGSPAPDAAAEAPATGSRENGQRLGLRFRRGSRGPIRPGEIPLIGVVNIDQPVETPAPAEPVETPSAESPVEEMALVSEEIVKPSRPRRSRAKRAVSKSEEGTPPEEAAGGGAPRPRRPRTRTRKKAE